MADEPIQAPAPAATATPKPAPASPPTAAPAAKPPAPTPPPPRPKTVTPEIEAFLKAYAAKATHLDDTDPRIPTILLDKSVFLDAMRRLKHEFGFDHLACITAVDVKDNFELIYNLWSYRKNRPFEVKVRTPRAEASVPSLCGLWLGANWLEREEWDMMGIRFEGHPNPTRIFLPEGWNGHPLRKDYDLKKEQFVALNDDGNDVVYQEPREGAW